VFIYIRIYRSRLEWFDVNKCWDAWWPRLLRHLAAVLVGLQPPLKIEGSNPGGASMVIWVFFCAFFTMLMHDPTCHHVQDAWDLKEKAVRQNGPKTWHFKSCQKVWEIGNWMKMNAKMLKILQFWKIANSFEKRPQSSQNVEKNHLFKVQN